MGEPADWAIEILASAEEILVPVKKLWKEYVSQERHISLEEFMHALEVEDRHASKVKGYQRDPLLIDANRPRPDHLWFEEDEA